MAVHLTSVCVQCDNLHFSIAPNVIAMSSSKDTGLIHPPQSQTQPLKGRGAVSNMEGRFEVYTHEDYDDGWGQDEAEEFRLSRFTTEVTEEHAKTILARNASPDLPFNLSLNPYRGCEHGCIYCYARPSHSYLGLSPGLDFESRIFAKVNAPQLLRRELAKPSYAPEPIAFGVNTDAYQPCERKLQLTRKILEVLYECRQPAYLITKNALIERDLDLIVAMDREKLTAVTITITTLDHSVARTLEPRCSSPTRRLETVRRLTDAGVPVWVNAAPMIPFINDSELEKIIEASAKAGAVGASYIILRLPWEVNPLFQEWLVAHFPDRAQRVMNRIRDMRDGKDYSADFGKRMHGEGVWADLIKQRFKKSIQRYGMNNRDGKFWSLDTLHFRRPIEVPVDDKKFKDTSQLDLFG